MSDYKGKNFTPYGNYTVAATSSSQNTAITQPSNTSGVLPACDLLITNMTSAVAFLKWGMTSQTATTASFAVAPGAVITVNMEAPMTNIAVILASGSGNVYISVGSGT